MQGQKIAFPTQGLAGFFRVKNELNQYGFFLNWRVTRDPTARGKTPVYLVEASPFYLAKMPSEIEANEPIRVHLFMYSSQDRSETASIGCAVGLCEITTDLGLVAFGTLESAMILEFKIDQLLEYVPEAIDTDLHLTILKRLHR